MLSYSHFALKIVTEFSSLICTIDIGVITQVNGWLDFLEQVMTTASQIESVVSTNMNFCHCLPFYTNLKLDLWHPVIVLVLVPEIDGDEWTCYLYPNFPNGLTFNFAGDDFCGWYYEERTFPDCDPQVTKFLVTYFDSNFAIY